MRHQAGNPSVAVKKRVNPQKAVMRRRRAQNRVRPIQLALYFLKTFQETRQRSRADGDMVTDLYISPTQFAGHYLYTYFRVRVFNPQQIFRQLLAEAGLDLTDTLTRDRAPFQTAAVNPSLDCDMRFRFQLQIA